MPEVNQTIRRLSDIGWKEEGAEGRNCLSYSETEDRSQQEVRVIGEKLKVKAEQNGLELEVKEDPFGNVYVTLAGNSPRKIVMCSHIDSVKRGGRYDGVLGIAAGLDVLERLIEEKNVPEKTIEVISFRSEESSITKTACLGSMLATGQITISQLETVKNESLGNKTMMQILQERNLSPTDIGELLENPPLDGKDIAGVIELHIEQSGVLEASGKAIGIVDQGIGGAIRREIRVGKVDQLEEIPSNTKCFEIVIKGVANHSGGTPMNGEKIAGKTFSLRRDALVAMAKFLTKLNRKHLTEISVPEGSINTVPGEARATIYLPENRTAESLNAILSQVCLPGMTAEAIEVTKETRDIQAIREDTVNAAMRIIETVEKTGEEMALKTEGKARSTVGNITMTPHPDSTTKDGILRLATDQRRIDNRIGDAVHVVIDQRLKAIETVSKVPIDRDESGTKISLATPFEDQRLQDMATEIYREMYAEEPVKMGSMAGHDTKPVAKSQKGGKVPAIVVFVRGMKGGISHHPSEYSTPEDISAGTDLLERLVKKAAHEL